MISTNFNLPLSLSELNSALEECPSALELYRYVGLKDFKRSPITSETFFSAIKYVIESYSDLTSDNLMKFINRTKQLFPLEGDQTSKVMSSFWRQIKQKIHSEDEKCRIKFQTDRGLLGIEDILTVYHETFDYPAETRVKHAFLREDNSNLKKKVENLQILLNLLILEEDMFQLIQPVVDLVFKLENLNRIVREGCFTVIRLSAIREATFFEIPENLEEKELFAFWINFSCCFRLNKSQGKTYISLKPVKRWKANPTEIKKKLLDLKGKTGNESIKFLIEKLTAELDKTPLIMELVEKNRALIDLRLKLSSSLLSKKNYNEHMEIKATPAFYSLIPILNKIDESVLGIPRDLPIANYQDLKELLEFWKKNHFHQERLFQFAHNQLNSILETMGRSKENLRFTKSLLATSKDFIIPKMRSTLTTIPSHAQILIQKEETNTKKSTGKHQQSRSISKSKEQFLPEIPSHLPKKEIECEHTHEDSKIETDKELIIKEEEKELPSSACISLYPLDSNNPGSIIPLKQKLPGSNFPFDFDERVERWHHHPFGEPLNQHEFPDYNGQSIHNQILAHLFHTLNPVVDRFYELGIRGTWHNTTRNKEDLRFVIPAEIQYKGFKYRGFIAYAIDENKICYHKGFSRRIEQDILGDLITRSFNEYDFPELRQASLMVRNRHKALPQISTSQTKVEIDPIFGNIIIKDLEKELSIELFKVAKDEL